MEDEQDEPFRRSVVFAATAPISPLTVSIDACDGGETRLRVHGEIDLTTSQTFQEQLERFAVPHGRVVLDLSGVSFIDSMGLRALWTIRQRFAAIDGRLSLASPSPNVERLLHVTKLHKVFDQVG